MLYHINLTHEKQTLGENSHECFKCHSRFGRKCHLIMHLKETHQENEPFFCDKEPLILKNLNKTDSKINDQKK